MPKFLHFYQISLDVALVVYCLTIRLVFFSFILFWSGWFPCSLRVSELFSFYSYHSAVGWSVNVFCGIISCIYDPPSCQIVVFHFSLCFHSLRIVFYSVMDYKSISRLFNGIVYAASILFLLNMTLPHWHWILVCFFWSISSLSLLNRLISFHFWSRSSFFAHLSFATTFTNLHFLKTSYYMFYNELSSTLINFCPLISSLMCATYISCFCPCCCVHFPTIMVVSPLPLWFFLAIMVGAAIRMIPLINVNHYIFCLNWFHSDCKAQILYTGAKAPSEPKRLSLKLLLSKLDWALKTHWNRVLHHSLWNFYLLHSVLFCLSIMVYTLVLSQLDWDSKMYWTRVLHHSLLSSLSHWIRFSLHRLYL